MSVLPEPENDLEHLAWLLEAAFLSSRPANRMCFSTAYQNVARREAFGSHQDFWLALSSQVRAHFQIKE